MKNRFAGFLAILLLSVAVMAAGMKTVFIDRMNGFEVYLERAIQEAEVGPMVELVEEVQHPDFKTIIKKRFASSFEAAIFKMKTGRNEDTTLTLKDLKTQKELITYHFTMSSDDKTNQRSANEFVDKLKKLLDKSR